MNMYFRVTASGPLLQKRWLRMLLAVIISLMATIAATLTTSAAITLLVFKQVVSHQSHFTGPITSAGLVMSMFLIAASLYTWLWAIYGKRRPPAPW